MIKTFEQLRSHIWDERQYILELIPESMEDATEFERARWVGMIYVYDDILSELRNTLKYGELTEELE